MSLEIGDRLPHAVFHCMEEQGLRQKDSRDIFGGKKIVLFSVPGAFTPTCHNKHFPGFMSLAAEIKSKGIDAIYCLAVNDPFVMKAWGEALNLQDEITLLPDGNGEFTRKLGLTMDGSDFGLGQRGKRFALIAEEEKITWLGVEDGGGLEVSSAEKVLAQL